VGGLPGRGAAQPIRRTWNYTGAPQVGAEPSEAVTLVEGVTFCISARTGDITPGAEQGLFFQDARFLSAFELLVDEVPLQPLSVTRTEPFAATMVGRQPPPPATADSTVLVIRRRYIGDGMREDIAIFNASRVRMQHRVALAVEADFADLFEVKEGRTRPTSGADPQSESDRVRFDMRTGGRHRSVDVRGEDQPVVTDNVLEWDIIIPPHGRWETSVYVGLRIDGHDVASPFEPDRPTQLCHPGARLRAWRQTTPTVVSADPSLSDVLATSLDDIGSLRIAGPEPDAAIIAAGAPWFMTLFGRDALLTSSMLMCVDPNLARATLQVLARHQGRRFDPRTEEQPGRILHEIRCGIGPSYGTPDRGDIYYGSVDATPLFVMVLGELHRWADRGPLTALLPHADRALDWIETDGDRDGDGFIEYERLSDNGLVNQGWKDSFDGVTFASGAIAEPPIALAEVQGYVYAAFAARAGIARQLGDDSGAARWTEKARRLRRDFNDQFWLPDRGYFALGLDRDKRPIDALASNMGHCLYTGIVEPDRARAVVGHLTGEDLFSGFGVRTLAASMGAYNPMSYHNGSVWPHDNAIVAAGLMRYGFVAEAQRVAVGVLGAARHFNGRLPELFCGFERTEFPEPIRYPTACSPQAWAAASPISLLHTLLRFEPSMSRDRVWCSPALLPTQVPLRIDGLRLHDAGISVDVQSATEWTVDGLPDDVQLIRRPPSDASISTGPAEVLR
jgi:glycogen debranching enzyme